MLPVRRARRRRAGQPHARGVRRARRRAAASTSVAAAAAQARAARPRHARVLEIDGRRDRAAPAAGRDPRAAVRPPGRHERRGAVRRPARRRRPRVVSVRVEVSRLRKLLGPWIDTERYRLTCDVETDVRRVEGLLAAGAVREAAEAYPGPLLPGSEAPGVVREREHLDALAAPGGDDRRRPRGPVGVGPHAPAARTTSAPGSACSRSSSSATRGAACAPPGSASCVQR